MPTVWSENRFDFSGRTLVCILLSKTIGCVRSVRAGGARKMSEIIYSHCIVKVNHGKGRWYEFLDRPMKYIMKFMILEGYSEQEFFESEFVFLAKEVEK